MRWGVRVWLGVLLLAAALGATEAVTLQLKWKHQFQFAGYYMAKEKGFYAAKGLDVTIQELQTSHDVYQDLFDGKTHFAIGSSDMLIHYLQGDPIVALATIYQKSPLVILSLQSSRIRQVSDLLGKRFMAFRGFGAEDLRAIMHKEGLPFDKVDTIPTSFNIQDLIDGKTDAYNGYVTNEPFFLEKAGIAYDMMQAADYGVYLYGDSLFTTRQMVRERRDTVVNFREASIEGWRYALEHIEETVAVIEQHYNSQAKSTDHLLYEGQRVRDLTLYPAVEIGHMSLERWRSVATLFEELGMTQNREVGEDFLLAYHLKPNLRLLYGALVVLGIALAYVLLRFLFTYRLAKQLRAEIAVRRQKEQELLAKEQMLIIQSRQAAMGEMLGMIAHQWRQPLATINMILNGMQLDLEFGTPQPEAIGGKITTARQQIQHLSETIDDFRHFFRPRADKSAVSLHEIVHKALTIIGPSLANHGIEVVLQPQGDTTLHLHEREMIQALLNLLANAQEAIIARKVPEGAIRIVIDANPREALVSVCDNGGGVAPEHIPHLCEPYFTTKKQNGTGLGLYMAKLLVEKYLHGSFLFYNEATGACFVIRIPLTKDTDAA